VIAPRTAALIAGALVVGVATGATGVAMKLADAVAAGQGNGYGYSKGNAYPAPVYPVGRRRTEFVRPPRWLNCPATVGR
jgi:hypothetical protein